MNLLLYNKMAQELTPMPFLTNNLNIGGIKIMAEKNISELRKNAKDLTGQRFGKLIAKYPIKERWHEEIVWFCQCDCGNTCKIISSSLRNNVTKSCGCFMREQVSITQTTHGMTNTFTYESWQHMLQRCKNPRDKNYKNYGGRGIRVCSRWFPENNGFENFFTDMGEKPGKLTLERIDNDGNYEPGNCRWATPKEQRANQRIRKDQYWFIGFNVKTGEWGEDNNQHEFARKYDLARSGISRCLLNKQKQYKDWIFEIL